MTFSTRLIQILFLPIVIFISLGFSPGIDLESDIINSLSDNKNLIDRAKLLTSDEKEKLLKNLRRHENQTRANFKILLLKSLQGNDIERLSRRMQSEWRSSKGNKKDHVYLLLSLDDRKIQLTPGPELSSKLTAKNIDHIIKNITPYFSRGEYFEGLNQAALLINKELIKPKKKLSTDSVEEKSLFKGNKLYIKLGGLLAFILFVYLSGRSLTQRKYMLAETKSGNAFKAHSPLSSGQNWRSTGGSRCLGGASGDW